MAESKSEIILENPEEKPLIENRSSKASNTKRKTIIAIILVVIVAIAANIAVVIVIINKEDEFQIYYNITTSENNTIRNSFKEGCENYNEILGNINNGSDYNETDRDNFDICIPYKANRRKTDYNAIYLDIHGGAWISGDKDNVHDFCVQFEDYGIIAATMSYTLLNGDYKEYNIFRILDEITAAIKSIKSFLHGKGFDENKLELIISGGSAGGHLSLLYAYAIKNTFIPIKFIWNIVGPVTLEPQYWLTTKNESDSLENIEPDNITEAINEGRLIQMNGSETYVETDNVSLVSAMNNFLGRKSDSDFNEIFINVDTREINETSEKYQELLKKTRFAYPITYITNTSIPSLCTYSGKDEYIGVAHYAHLKETFDANDNANIDNVYFRYGHHNPFQNISEYDKNATKYLSDLFKNYTSKYLETFNNTKS